MKTLKYLLATVIIMLAAYPGESRAETRTKYFFAEAEMLSFCSDNVCISTRTRVISHEEIQYIVEYEYIEPEDEPVEPCEDTSGGPPGDDGHSC